MTGLINRFSLTDPSASILCQFTDRKGRKGKRKEKKT